jgi:hypothetical protein
MAVFEHAHQDTIDRINYDGWRYLAGRTRKLNEGFGGHGGVIGSAIAIQVKGVEAWIEQGDPVLEWRLADRNLGEFTHGFRISVGADSESASNRVICKPVDWYMLCISLQIGLNMASLGIATPKAT